MRDDVAEDIAERPALQRADGDVRIAFRRRGAETGVSALYQAGSGKARVMRLANGAYREAIVLNTSGGMTDGDRFACAVTWEDGARGLVQSQAAERIYRSRGGAAEQATQLHVGTGASAVWVPQETILFDGGRCRRRLDIAAEGDGEVVACEALVFGRTARGEVVRDGLMEERWRVRRDGRLVYADTFRLEGDIARELSSPAVGGGGGVAAAATLLYVGPRSEDMRDRVRDAGVGEDVTWGATARMGVTVVRMLAAAPLALRQALEARLGAMLAGLTPAPAGPPRAWAL